MNDNIITILLKNRYKPYSPPLSISNNKFDNDIRWLAKKYEHERIITNGHISEKFTVYIPKKDWYNFSTMTLRANIATFFIKDNDFDNPIIYGISAVGFSPMVGWPKPKIKVILNKNDELWKYNIKSIDENHPRALSMCYSKENHQELFDVITNKLDKSYIYE